MWPWGHLAVGYLLYSASQRWQARPLRHPHAALAAFGALLPDLVDKPLAWQFGVLETGRELGHSLLVAGLVLMILYIGLAPRIGTSSITAFGIGYLSHPLTDIPFREVIAGNFEFLSYLVWPLLPPPSYPTEPSFVAHLAAYQTGPYEALQLALFVVAAVQWYRDGLPGLAALKRVLGLDWEAPASE